MPHLGFFSKKWCTCRTHFCSLTASGKEHTRSAQLSDIVLTVSVSVSQGGAQTSAQSWMHSDQCSLAGGGVRWQGEVLAGRGGAASVGAASAASSTEDCVLRETHKYFSLPRI